MRLWRFDKMTAHFIDLATVAARNIRSKRVSRKLSQPLIGGFYSDSSPINTLSSNRPVTRANLHTPSFLALYFTLLGLSIHSQKFLARFSLTASPSILQILQNSILHYFGHILP